MESLSYFLRLSTAGLLLDVESFQMQRDNPKTLRDGFVVVLLIGVLVGVAGIIGNLLSMLAMPDPQAFLDVIKSHLERAAFVTELQRGNPGFSLDPVFDQLTRLVNVLRWSGLIGAVVTPVVYVINWLVYGAVAHVAARMLGGDGSFAQTLGCTALASGANWLAVVQIIPFAQVAGTTLLGLIGCYLGLRAAHHLPAWRAFWATLIGPIFLGLLLIVLGCGALAVLIAVGQGGR